VYGNPGVAACGGRTGQTGQVCTATDGRGNTTTYAYDSKGDLTSVTPPAPLGVTRYTYDALGRVASVTDGKNQTTRYSYDPMGRTKQVLYAGTTSCTTSSCITYTYDSDGNQLSQTDGGGTISYRYDTLGRQTGKTLPGQAEQVLTYDPAGNLTSISDPGGTTTYRYDTVNQLVDLAEPGGSCTTSPTVRCTTFGYNNNGARTSTTYPTSPATVLTMTPDDSGRVKQIKAVTGTTTQSDFAYTYTDAAGTGDAALARTRTDRTPGTFQGRTTSYGYDTLNQLKTAVETDSAGATTASWSYAYDLAGNRTSATMSPTNTDTYGYNAANQLVSRDGSATGWAYDANGNETGAVVFGDKDRTTTVNAKDQYTNFRVGTVDNAASYLGAGQAERTVMGPTTSTHSPTGIASSTRSGVTNSYVRDPNGTLIALRTGGASYYYLFDGLGSVTGLVDAAGKKVNSYSYDPYGMSRAKTETVDNSFEYTGGWLDGFTGLYKLGIRYYDPTLGRFTQPDPTGQDPHYTYAGNAPTTFTDPTGAAFSTCSGTFFISSLITGAAITLAPISLGASLVVGAAVATAYFVGEGLTC
jgi:RHS repeat-associated protein